MNPFEEHRRSEKATKLANAIHAAGVTAESVAAVCFVDWRAPVFWENAAKLAECEVPNSETTVEEVIGKLRAIEVMEARVKNAGNR